MPSFQSFQNCPHQKLFFDLKLQDSKDKRRARLDKKIFTWLDAARFLMGTIFLVITLH